MSCREENIVGKQTKKCWWFETFKGRKW